ncbi:MAG TPA: VWA domain-containing protein [Vicinamibacterales bacterium]|jgi:VWFA-related protein|nr:VWA domain-containing protein [Vicinamibacterales bacterium]
MSSSKSIGVRAALLALMAGPIVFGQATQQQTPVQAPPQQPPVFRTGTEIVRVDATVFDKSGKPVTDLSEKDFDVMEDGVSQPIKSFKLVEVNGQPSPDNDESLAIRSREHAALEASKDDVRVFLVFWDEYHIGEFESTLYARTQLSRFLLTAFGPTDLVAIMDPLTPTDAIAFSRDRRQLADAAARLRGRRNVYMPARSVLEEAQLTTRNVEEIRSQVTTGAIVSALVHLGAMKEGRKSLILFTEGAPVVLHDAGGMNEIIRSANASNTAIYTVDPRGMMTGSTWLEGVADDTGGEWIRSNDMERALRRVVQQSTAFYLIGYDATMSPKDGRFHKIKVRVKRSGLQVRSRAGFWAPTVGDLVRARGAVRKPPPSVTDAVTQLVPQSSARAADVWVGVEPKTAGQAKVTLMWMRRGTAAGMPAVASADLAVTGEKGPVFSGPVDGGVTFDAPPGAFSLALTFKNASGEIVDKELRSVVVPDLAKSALEIGSPVVLKASNPLELRALQAEPDAAPFPGRDFVRTDRLLIRVRLYGSASAGVTPTARLLNADGAGTTVLAVRRDQPEGPFEIDLPLSSLAPAAWIVAVEARSGSERREVMVPFRLVR